MQEKKIKSRNELYRKLGTAPTIVKKSGCKIITTNRSVIYGTYRLSDGTLITIPRDEHTKEVLQKMEETIKKNK